MKAPSILIIDDEPLMRLSIADALKATGYEVRAAATGNEGMALLGKQSFDMMITDLRLPGADGLSLLQACKQRSPRTEVIVITAHASVDSAVEALKLGAYDYITKPFLMDELILIVERVARVLALRHENVQLREQLDGRFSFPGVVGKNEQMRAAIERVKALASADGPVLLLGEAGTGKELLANTIHRNSARRDHGLIKVTCRGQAPDALEIELFGRDKGLSPEAGRPRRGRLELAHKGTLYLDEIADLSDSLQEKLYHCIRERRYQRLGTREWHLADVRVICGSAHDLPALVGQGRFRRELYDLLAPATVQLPPLRERREDLLALAKHLLEGASERQGKVFKGLSEDAQNVLLAYSFPGNVQELERLIEQSVTSGRSHEEVQVWDLCGLTTCPYLGGPGDPTCGLCREGVNAKAQQGSSLSLAAAHERFEHQYILDTLERTGGDVTEAARTLGLAEEQLKRKCQRYGITLDHDPGH